MSAGADAGAAPAGEHAALREAARLLHASGLAAARPGVAGKDREILVVEVAAPDMARLAELAPELKALGFRYVAVDLAPVAEAAAEDGDARGA